MTKFIRSKVSGAGRVVLPVAFRSTLGIADGTEVIFSLDDHGIRIKTLDQAVRDAQELVGRSVAAEVELVEELRQARREDGTFG